MKILVFSDSHGMTADMCDVALRLQPDVIFHLGDYVEDAHALRQLLPETTVYTVRGNGDMWGGEPLTLDLTLDGVHIFACHGHTYRVKLEIDSLVNTGLCAGAKLVLFGHTHQPCWDHFEDMIVLNPGSIGFKGSYAVIETRGGDFHFALKRVGDD